VVHEGYNFLLFPARKNDEHKYGVIERESSFRGQWRSSCINTGGQMQLDNGRMGFESLRRHMFRPGRFSTVSYKKTGINAGS
jgi:hypothetical protein